MRRVWSLNVGWSRCCCYCCQATTQQHSLLVQTNPKTVVADGHDEMDWVFRGWDQFRKPPFPLKELAQWRWRHSLSHWQQTPEKADSIVGRCYWWRCHWLLLPPEWSPPSLKRVRSAELTPEALTASSRQANSSWRSLRGEASWLEPDQVPEIECQARKRPDYETSIQQALKTQRLQGQRRLYDGAFLKDFHRSERKKETIVKNILISKKSNDCILIN